MVGKVLPGKPYPLGSTWDGKGVNFAIFSETATKVELCLFDEPASKSERERISLKEVTGHVWHACVTDLHPGQTYGYRIHSTYEPEAGLRFNPAKLVIDPYAKAISGRVNWEAPVFGYQLGHQDADLSRADLLPRACAPSKETMGIKYILRQRMFYVRIQTMVSSYLKVALV